MNNRKNRDDWQPPHETDFRNSDYFADHAIYLNPRLVEQGGHATDLRIPKPKHDMLMLLATDDEYLDRFVRQIQITRGEN